MKEIWRDIINYEGLYQVSNLGRIKSLAKTIYRYNGFGYYNQHYPEKILTVFYDRRGYPMTFLYKNGKRKTRRIHRLVAEAFIPNPEDKTQVNHINGCKTDNRVCNLEWATNDENMEHAVSNGLHKNPFVSNNPRSKEVICIETGEVFNTITEATKKYKVHNANVSACCRGKKQTAGGYHWKYKDAS